MTEPMRYISLFSGIEAASAAWSQLGWEPMAFSEIEPFCCDLLGKRFPNVPNLGDVSTVDWSKYEGAADVVIGGSPCQAFSVAGKRGGMLDERGLLMLQYVRAVREVKPRWVVWENVPGVLSQDGGRAFATLLEELEECGYSLAWRVLDAQYWRVAQRRRRVFLVGHPIAGCAAAVLFEPDSLRGDNPTSREKREGLAAAAGRGAAGRCFGMQGNVCDRRSAQNGNGVSVDVSPTLNTVDRHVVAGCLTPWDVQSRRIYGTEIAAPTLSAQDRDGGHNSVNVLAFDTTQVTDPNNRSNPQIDDPCHTISAASHPPTIAFSAGQSDKTWSICAQEEVSPTLRSSPGNCSNMPAVVTQYGDEIAGTLMARADSSPCADRGQNVICVASGQANAETMVECCPTLTRRNCKDSPITANGYALRRLTPMECERLQGFPDGWTDIYADDEHERIDWAKCPDDVDDPDGYAAFMKNPVMTRSKGTPDTPRYKAIGNSMAVPVIRWIGKRIAMVEEVM